MLELLAALTLWSTAAQATETQSVGACAWSQLPEADRQEVLTAFGTGMRRAMNALHQHDAALQRAGRICAGRSDIPELWMQGSIASHVIQIGSADIAGFEPSRLDQAWDAAPAEARDCAWNNAARAFRIEGPRCENRRAPQSFLTALGLSPSEASTRAAAEQVLIYMNAKAQGQIADGLIAAMPPSTP